MVMRAPLEAERNLDPDYHSRIRHDVLPYIQHSANLLDFGGGDGATAAEIKRLGLTDRIGVADLVAPAHNLDFNYRGDLTNPDLVERITAEQGPFDTILCLDVLEHFVDPWEMLRRLHGMLAPGGQLIASIPNVRHYTVSFPLLIAGRWTYGNAEVLDRTHLRFFERRSAAALMASSGLKVEKVVPVPRQRLRDIWMLRGLRWFCESFIALQYILIARNPDSGQ